MSKMFINFETCFAYFFHLLALINSPSPPRTRRASLLPYTVVYARAARSFHSSGPLVSGDDADAVRTDERQLGPPLLSVAASLRANHGAPEAREEHHGDQHESDDAVDSPARAASADLVRFVFADPS